MTPSQIDAAFDILADREEIATMLAAMRITHKVRIVYEVVTKNRGADEPKMHFTDGPKLAVTPSIRKLLLTGVEESLAEIDAKLLALGVDLAPLHEADQAKAAAQ